MREDIIESVGENGLKTISLRKLLGKGYDNALFFNCHARYRIFSTDS